MKALHSAVILLVLASATLADFWHTESVTSDSSGCEYTSLTLDSSDYPHISYRDEPGYMLHYARWNGSNWHVETVDADGSVGDYSSIALDSLGYPHISYYDYQNKDLKYAYWNGSVWRIETVDSEGKVGQNTSLELDSSDYPHISYYDSTNCDLKYARWVGDSWAIEAVDLEGDVGSNASLALDSSDYPHIAYTNSGLKSLEYARWDGSSWHIETVDTVESGVPPSNISLALDASGNPHISYFKNNALEFKYAWWSGSSWHFETVESGGGVGVYSSLALDDSGFPHLSYCDFDERDLKYAQWDGVVWQIEIVDSEGDVGRYTSLELDSSYKPHISYCDYTNHCLKYTRYGPTLFHLETPQRGEVVTTLTPTLDWSDDDNPDLTGYTLWWGTDPDFNTYNEVTGIHESKYTIPSGIDDGDRIYWRVKSIDDGGGEYWAEELDWYFDTDLFHLLSPEKGEVVYAFPFTFDWEDHDLDGFDSYTLWWGTDPDFITYNEVADIGESEYTITGGIEDGARVYWRVKSLDSEGGEYWAEELDWYFDIDLGGGVDVADFDAGATDEGVLVNWRFSGEEPAGVRVLWGTVEPELISGNLPGDSTRYLDRDVKPGVDYVYWLEVVEADGRVSRFGPTEAVTVPGETPELALYAAYPSPSREVVNFAYSLPADGRATLSVYDLSGRRVATLLDSELTAGRHEVSWNCTEIPSGVYLYRLETNARSLTRRLVVSR